MKSVNLKLHSPSSWLKAIGTLTALALSGCALAAATATAADKPVPPAAPASDYGAGKPAPPSVEAAQATAPPLYTLVNSGWLIAPDGTQTRGTVTCPTRTVPWGGGVYIVSESLFASVNSTFPLGKSWVADVNNASGSSTSFMVWAVCAKKPRLYEVRRHGGYNPPRDDGSSWALVRCTEGTVPLGGGGYSSSSNTAVDIKSSNYWGDGPAGWSVHMNNRSGLDAEFEAVVVCGKRPAGYRVVEGPEITNPSGDQSRAEAACPSPSVPIGGGVFVFAWSPAVNINSTWPTANGWASWENNASADDTTIKPYAICAGT